MKITRDVVYDLLPGYFAGEVSGDTRALIDEFLTTDPEFSRMTARFKRLFDERGAVHVGDISTERERLERARSRAERRQISAAFAIAYSLAAAFPLVMALLRGQPVQGKSLFISVSSRRSHSRRRLAGSLLDGGRCSDRNSLQSSVIALMHVPA